MEEFMDYVSSDSGTWVVVVLIFLGWLIALRVGYIAGKASSKGEL